MMTNIAESPEPEPDSQAGLTIDMDMRHADWRDLAAPLKAQAEYVWAHLRLPAAEVSVVLADDAFIATLNEEYRAKSGATNVLSFPALDFAAPANAAALEARLEPRLMGDIIMAYETLAREAQAQGKSLENHARHLLTHGLLHLLGHDHEAAPEAAAMEQLESDILTAQGLPSPYENLDGKHA